NNPASRRIMTNFYTLADLSVMALYHCAYSMPFQFSCNKLNAILHQRSQDMLAANNWNVVQYSVLTMMMAQVSGFEPGEFVHVIADCHIYDRHIPAVEEIIKNEPKPAPKFIIDPEVKDFYAFTRDSFRMEGYEYSDFSGKIPVAV
ncbi:MAG: thymidylate synthase, partial [Oscillospiraceae bacterium]|nr:thymidylate synthase [Oscillospiraceae bacterium]